MWIKIPYNKIQFLVERCFYLKILASVFVKKSDMIWLLI